VSRLFAAAGVDYQQWRAVSRTLLRVDFRVPLATDGATSGGWRGLLLMAAIFGLFGSGAAIFVAANPDVLLTGTLSLSYLSVMLVTTLLTQHGTTMLATTDYAILGARPVSSQTFLAIRLTNVLFHAMLITALLAHPVVIAYTVAHGGSLRRGAAAVVAIVAWAWAVALLVVVAHTALLRLVSAVRLGRALGYLQVVSGLMVYSGMLVVGRTLREPFIRSAEAPDAWWLLAIPPAWFASYLELAAGELNSTTWIRFALSGVAIVVPLFALTRTLGLDYAARLADLQATARHDDRTTRTPGFPRGTERAVAILVLTHFRHDLRVRTRVLAIVPLALMYLVVDVPGFDLLAMAVLLFPALLAQNFAASDTYHASWIYEATPTAPDQIVVALKNIAAAYFLLPFLLFMVPLFAWRSGDVAHALVHTVMLGSISYLALQTSLAITPRLPFSMPIDKTRTDASLFAWIAFVLVGGHIALAALDRWIYVAPWRIAAAFAALAALSAGAERLLASRARQSQPTR
jgi:hypothetical protein